MLFFTDENHLPEVVFYCRRCESFVDSAECPYCSCQTAPIERNTANHTLWGENLERMKVWIKRGRVIPEVE